MVFRVGAEMDVKFLDFSKKKPEIIHPLTLMSKKILILSFLDRNY